MADSSSGARNGASPWWRFSLKQLLAATAIVALGCVALRSADATWIGAMFGLVWLALAASVLLALYRDGPVRAFWVGFALVGWLYLLLPWFSSSIGFGLHPDYLVTTRLSHRAYTWLYYRPAPAQPMAPGAMGGGMPGGPPIGPGGPGMYPGAGSYHPTGGAGGDGVDSGSAGMGSGYAGAGPGMPGMGDMGGMGSMMVGMGVPPGMSAFTGPSQEDFTSVSHALWTLLLAFCGGWFAQWLCATRDRRAAGA